MKIEHLQEFFVLAKYLNFSVASRQLKITQPALSNHIKALEQELGVALFNRKQPMRLTDDGLVFLDGVQHILTDYDRLMESMSPASKRKPVLIQGSYPKGSDIERVIEQDYAPTEIDYDLHDMALNNIRSGESDLAFVPTVEESDLLRQVRDDPKLDCMLAGPQKLSIAVGHKSPLYHKRTLEREDIEGMEIVVFSGALFDEWKAAVALSLGSNSASQFRLTPVRRMEDINAEAFEERLFICYDHIIHRHFLNNKDVAVFDSIDGTPLYCNIYLIFSKNNSKAMKIVAKVAEL